MKYLILPALILSAFILSNAAHALQPDAESQRQKKYWDSGKAEITSYTLEKSRYGQTHNGHSVLIFVTESFLADKQVKSDNNNANDIPILKYLNSKKFITGIYPYSILTTVFFPRENNRHAIKASYSAQEWCGHSYTQLNNRNKFDILSRSYFEDTADRDFSLEKSNLEDEVWTKIRLNPSSLTVGKTKVIPSLEYLDLYRKEIKAYSATTELIDNKNGIKSYIINYPELKRKLTINFSSNFPYTIESWQEVLDGKYISKATKLSRIKSDYWRYNNSSDTEQRKLLKID